MRDESSLESMSPYEQRAWHESLKRLQDPPYKRAVPKKVRELAESATGAFGRTAGKAFDYADQHMPVYVVKDIIQKAFDGTLQLTFLPALRSASVERSIRAHQRTNPGVETAADLMKLDLQVVDRHRRRKGMYVAASAIQGGGTSVAVTGAVVGSTVSGGAAAATVVGAVAVDAVAALAMMGRSVGSVAVRYGYDVRLPDEELFAMGVLSLGMAGTVGAKQQALAALSRLTQQMMRRATWKQLNEHIVVRAIARMYQLLGLRLTQKRLAQVVPFVGVGINATLSAAMTDKAYKRAEDAYRLRFLSEKYGIDPRDWLSSAEPDDADDISEEEVPMVDEILEEECEQEEE